MPKVVVFALIMLLGPLVSFALGYAVFYLCAYVFGSGAYIDNHTAKGEAFFTTISIPLGFSIFVIGSIACWFIGLVYKGLLKPKRLHG